MTTIVYLAPADIQVARVDKQTIVYFCSALARAGAAVELVTLGIRLRPDERHRAANPLDLYGVETPFPVTTLPTSIHQGSRSRWVDLRRLLTYTSYSVRRVRHGTDDEPLVFYTKNYAPTLALLALRLHRRFLVVFEAHTTPRRPTDRFVLRHVDGVVANSYALARDLEERGYSSSVLPTHQGVDLARYEVTDGKKLLRKQLGLPVDKAIAVYTGKIHPGYAEVDDIVSAADSPECRDVLFVLVGGREDHVLAWRSEVEKRGIHNVTFTGFIPPRDVHVYQLAADVLLLYYPSGIELNAYRSPGKLFGYMATGVPIVSVDLPVLREVLGEPPAATLVPPDSPDALAQAVHDVLGDPEPALAAAAAARDRVTEFTWDRRAVSVLEFIESLRPTNSAPMPEATGAGQAG